MVLPKVTGSSRSVKMKVTLENGRVLALTRTSARGSNLPKRAPSAVEVIVNGNPEKIGRA